MHKNNHKIIDSVSASELLDALNTLQIMNDQSELQISFCDHTKIDHDNQNRIINFDMYMAKKTDTRNIKAGQYTQRKSGTPLKEKTYQIAANLQNMKSKSHSPVPKRVQKTERPTVRKIMPTQRDKENKKDDTNKKNNAIPRASNQSNRILNQKQKHGAAYVPIQLRTEGLLKDRQTKIAQMLKQKQMTTKLQQKQCTFKPIINKTYKKPKIMKEQKKLSQIEQQQVRFTSFQESHAFLSTPSQPVNPNMSIESHEYQQFTLNSKDICDLQSSQTKANFKKCKNDKFNDLLDLIS